MSEKCLVISICFVFVGVTVYIFFLAQFDFFKTTRHPTLTFSTFVSEKVHCDLYDNMMTRQKRFKSPSLASVIHDLAKEENPGISTVRGLAVYFNLRNACQPLHDVSKASAQVYKFALVTLANETACPLQRLAVNAQNTGYAVLVHFLRFRYLDTYNVLASEEKVVIPVATTVREVCRNESKNSLTDWSRLNVEMMLSNADRTNVEIRVPAPDRNELKKMKGYLKYLFLWLFAGPLVYFVEWMRRSEFKLEWLRSGGQQPNQRQGNGGETASESETQIMEEGELNRTEHSELHSLATEGTVTNTHTEGEMQPLLNGVRDQGDYTRQRRGIRRVLKNIRNCFRKVVVGLCYLILIIAALPVGISTGGLSFFRFDQGDNSFTEDDYILNPFKLKGREWIVRSYGNSSFSSYKVPIYLNRFVTLWWSPFQVFCFFLYSYFARKAAWTVSTNYPKVIRSDWFSSNIYLLVLAIVVPTSQPETEPSAFYFANNNILCTVSNVLFIMILNKHGAVTRYILFLSICMICAYVESDIVALVYYTLNSTGSLDDVKLTALRTAAIGLTLSVSLNSSMHIIRKLCKPQESLFEGLGEK